MRGLFVFLMIAALSAASLDQNYTHIIDRDGSSSIEKTLDISVFLNQVPEGALENAESVCESDPRLRCSVDPATKMITMSEDFRQGEYYEFESVTGLPSITYTITLKKIPTDRFAERLDDLMMQAGAFEEAGDGSAEAIDLSEKAENAEAAFFLRNFDVRLVYTLVMPAPVQEASFGEVSGNTVTLDLADLLEDSKQVTVRSSELNSGYIVLIFAVIVLGALALSFRGGTRKK